MYQKVAYASGDGVELVTSLPTSPHDGQEVILTDSTTAGTYFWRLRYVSGRSSNKWVFVGGAPATSEVATSEAVTSTSFAAVATAGPSITLPVAGDYVVAIGAQCINGDAGSYDLYMSYDIGGTAAATADQILLGDSANGWTSDMTGARVMKKSGLTAVALTAKYKISGSTGYVRHRYMTVTPVAVGG